MDAVGQQGNEAAARVVRTVCCHCGRLLRAGEPRWSGDARERPWHFSCAERAGLSLSWMLVRQRMRTVSEPKG
ncbi:hypothetical protein [Azospirillum sp. SYSU D00513]|uniref:hypothetical protein n=1 Tax=Azospirillum sp. SYSU D00513 TaxID=2812561 RepID=UPI001A95B0BE|nr:hypothetical protein [Azospirillum sp. SYSU D00513]